MTQNPIEVRSPLEGYDIQCDTLIIGATKVFFISTSHGLHVDCGGVDILASLTLGHVAFFNAPCQKAATYEMR